MILKAIVIEVEKDSVIRKGGIDKREYKEGAILVTIPNTSFEDVLCLYGLSMPNLKVQVGSYVLVTMESNTRDFYYIGLPSLAGNLDSEFTNYIVKYNQLEAKYNALIETVNSLIKNYNGHTHDTSAVTTATKGAEGSATVTVTNPATTSKETAIEDSEETGKLNREKDIYDYIKFKENLKND